MRIGGLCGAFVEHSGHFLAPAPLGAWIAGRAELLRATRSMLFYTALADDPLRIGRPPAAGVTGMP